MVFQFKSFDTIKIQPCTVDYDSHTHNTLTHISMVIVLSFIVRFPRSRGNWMLTTIAVVVATADAAGRAAGKAELN